MFYGRLDSWSAATRPDVQSGGAGGGAGRLGVGGGGRRRAFGAGGPLRWSKKAAERCETLEIRYPTGCFNFE